MNHKIVAVGPFPPPYGGIASFMRGLHSLLATAEVSAEFLVTTSLAPNTPRTRKRVAKPWYLAQYALCLQGAAVCFDCNEFCFEYPNWKLALYWWLLKRTLRFRWVKMIHSGSLPDRFKTFSTVQKWMFNRMLNVVDVMVVVSQDLADWLTHEIGFRGSLRILGPLLPDDVVGIRSLEGKYPVDAEVERFVAAHDGIVLSIGVFEQVYGFHDVAAAVEILRSKLARRLGLVLVEGRPAVLDGPEFKQRLLADRPWILPLSGISHDLLIGVIDRSHVVVRGSKYESYGLSRVEALIRGKPVIATNVGETTGMLLYSYGDRLGLTHHLESCLSGGYRVPIQDWRAHFDKLAMQNWVQLLQLLRAHPDAKPYKGS